MSAYNRATAAELRDMIARRTQEIEAFTADRAEMWRALEAKGDPLEPRPEDISIDELGHRCDLCSDEPAYAAPGSIRLLEGFIR
jgi:hypothetical protein